MQNTILATKAAQLCGTNKMMVSRLIAAGHVKADVKQIGKRHLTYVDPDEVKSALENHRPRRSKVKTWRFCPHCGHKLDAVG